MNLENLQLVEGTDADQQSLAKGAGELVNGTRSQTAGNLRTVVRVPGGRGPGVTITPPRPPRAVVPTSVNPQRQQGWEGGRKLLV